ncbi:DUF305 domain-containing protein [Geminocystis sp. NIES-3708]|uniref:DUF305 domain-containing protein n=1 Tax=Geminocystis sp. NIES-3708 TaxID=1615909 RepID=UPI0009E7BC6E|nr:DUF305 domain-containing protein [Geminocystis sp. NIES-3708]
MSKYFTSFISTLLLTTLTGVVIGCGENNIFDSVTSSQTTMTNHTMMGHSAMNLGPADAEYDLRFIDVMIPHHEGAVIMAKEALVKSSRNEIKTLATEIIETQDKEISEMRQWRSSWYPSAPDTPMAWHSTMNHSMIMSEAQIASMRMDMDLGKADNEFDLRFINAMIPHHQGAVKMAKDLLAKSQRPEMQTLAQNIINSQQREIEQLQQWHEKWY